MASGQILREPFSVGERLQGGFVANHPDEPNFGGGNDTGHPVQHPEPRAQDGDDERFRFGQFYPGGRTDGGFDLDRFYTDMSGRFVSQQCHELIDEPAEGWRIGVLVPQHGEFVFHQRVIECNDVHVRTVTHQLVSWESSSRLRQDLSKASGKPWRATKHRCSAVPVVSLEATFWFVGKTRLDKGVFLDEVSDTIGGMSANEESESEYEDLPDLADGDDRPGIEDDLEFFDDHADGDDEDDDYPEDASEEDLDFAIAVYREDGEPAAQPLALETINDLEELFDALRRLPGDGGAVGVVSIMEEFFAIVRVRGKHVQVFLSDVYAAGDWPIARDICDFLGVELPEEDDDDDPSPVGDLNILADLGLNEFDLQTLSVDVDESTDELALVVLDKINFGQVARTVVEEDFS